MNRIKDIFKNKKKVLIPFLICGFPDLDTTEKLIYTMEKAGADMILLGIPFSDPIVEADLVIKANNIALQNGANINTIFQMLKKIRKNSNISLIFRTYANIVFSYGIEKFVSKASELGVDGLMLPDVPFAEKEEFSSVCEKYKVDFISIITPTNNERIKEIAQKSSGFLYYIDSPLKSKSEYNLYSELENFKKIIKEYTDTPIVTYLSDTDAVQALLKFADGVIIDNDIISLCEKNKSLCNELVAEYIEKIKSRY